MADVSVPEGRAEQRAEGPEALTLDEIARQDGGDDEDEWEYEYSTTETEARSPPTWSYPLSYPEFKERLAKAHHHSRGGYYKHWLESGPDQIQGHKMVGKTADAARNNDDEDDNGDEPTPAPEPDEDMLDIDPRLAGQGKHTTGHASPASGDSVSDEGEGSRKKNTRRQKDTDKMKQAEEAQGGIDDFVREIQIMELHSRNPIISYRGQVYEGQWAEVIGTEAILANHDDQGSTELPVLRNLPDGVDLLGASASRILTTKKLLKPKVTAENSLEQIRRDRNINIPAGKSKSEERAQQLRFLENMIALKIKKGERDHVTVYAQDPVGKNFSDNVDPDWMPRRRKPFRPDPDGRPRRGRRGGRPRGRGRGRRTRAGEGGMGTARADVAAGGLSMPTPLRWEELAGERRGEDENEEDGPSDGEQEDEDDGDSDGDEGDEDVEMTG
ncbi:hypothetical protein S40288_07842 [Stachybotrys chartarum IBT 40288]|nr:hypothetical protein S40288_07842 [Stachybotrys chartarum IBT 40288]